MWRLGKGVERLGEETLCVFTAKYCVLRAASIKVFEIGDKVF